MKYFACQYIYKKNIFLFGFIAQIDTEKKLSTGCIELCQDLIFEYAYLDKNLSNYQLESNYNSSQLGLKTSIELRIKDTSIKRYLERSSQITPIFTSQIIRQHILECDYDIKKENIDIIISKLGEFCVPFFSNHVNDPSSNIFSFIDARNSELLTEPPIKFATAEKKLIFSHKILNKEFQAKITYKSSREEIIDSYIKLIECEPIPYSLAVENFTSIHVEIFDNNKQLYYYHYAIPLKAIFCQTSSVFSATVIDPISEKHKHLRNVTHLLETNEISIGKSSYTNTHSISYNAYQNWFERMSNEDAVQSIIDIVGNCDKATIIDPFFQFEKSPKNKKNKLKSFIFNLFKFFPKKTQTQSNDAIYNTLWILPRLVGDVTIVTSSNSYNHLIIALSALNPLLINNLQLKIKKSSSLHDRYIITEKNSQKSIYSLSNSFSSIMKNNPIGLFEITGKTKLKLDKYLTELLNGAESLLEWSKKSICNHKQLKINSIYIKSNITNDDAEEIKIEKINNFLTSVNNFTPIDILHLYALEYDLQSNYFHDLIDPYKERITTSLLRGQAMVEMEQFMVKNNLVIDSKCSTYTTPYPGKLNYESFKLIQQAAQSAHRFNYDTNVYIYSYSRCLEILAQLDLITFSDNFAHTRQEELRTLYWDSLANTIYSQTLESIKSTYLEGSIISKLFSLHIILSTQKDINEDMINNIFKMGITVNELLKILSDYLYNPSEFSLHLLHKLLNDESNETDVIEFITHNTPDSIEVFLLILSQTSNLNICYTLLISYFCKDNPSWEQFFLPVNHKKLNILIDALCKINENERSNFWKSTISKTKVIESLELLSLPPSSMLLNIVNYHNHFRVTCILSVLYLFTVNNQQIIEPFIKKVKTFQAALNANILPVNWEAYNDYLNQAIRYAQNKQ